MSQVSFYIFIDTPESLHFWSIGIDREGKVAVSLVARSLAELQEISKKYHTIVVLSSAYCSLHWVSLAWLNEKKARLAIPFALEDRLASNINELHFSFAKEFYQNNSYLVVVCNKNYLESVENFLANNLLKANQLTVDFFALEHNEIVTTNQGSLINIPLSFQGYLPLNLAEPYLNKQSEMIKFFTLNPISANINKVEKTTEIIDYGWFAERLQKNKIINLLQGNLQQSVNSSKKWYYLITFSLVFYALTWLVINTSQLYILNKKIAFTDSKIAVIYQQFFPHSKQVISPRFRVEQLLKSQSNTEQTTFWFLLNAFTQAVDMKTSTIIEIKFAEERLQITLTSLDFNSLEVLQNKLEQVPIKVKKTQVSSMHQQVHSTLELKL